MLSRTIPAALLIITLAGCTAIEIDTNPQLPQLRVEAEAARAAEPATSATTPSARKLPGGVPLTGALAPTSGALNLTVEGALVMALANNRALQVDLYNPALRKTFEAEQRAAFDPVLSADLRYSSSRSLRSGGSGGFGSTNTGTGTFGGNPGGGTTPFSTLEAQATPTPTPGPTPTPTPGGFSNTNVNRLSISRQTTGGVGISEFLPTGTTIGINFDAGKSVFGSTGGGNVSGASNISGAGSKPYFATPSISISQQLLRGASINANLASLHQARLDTLSSEYELRGFTQTTVAQVEQAYWDLLYAERQVRILEDALKVAEQQLYETTERIRVGKLAASERFAAQAEVAQRREALINGRSLRETASLALLRLLSPPDDALKPRPIALLSEPVLPRQPFDDVEEHIAVAERLRPDLNQARLLARRDELDIVRTKNGLLPDLQFFINLGRTGFANSFGDAVSNIDDTKAHSLSTGLQFSYPLGNRAARAQYRRALLSRDQQLESISNLSQLVEQDVRGAIIDVTRIREQVDATAVTRQLQEETLRTEQEKFRVGRSTSLLVAQAERDLLTAQINELQAFVAYLKSIVDLYRLDGSLLERRGVVCPGTRPVSPDPHKPVLAE